MQIDPRHLHMLAAIVDSGGLTEGARALGKSQPSVSRTLAVLEARLGAALFEKGRRPAQPTELGRALAAEGRAIARATRQAARTVTSFSRGDAGTARVAGTPFFMDGVISGMLAAFQAAFPKVRVDQSYAFLPGLGAMLEAGAIELAICPLAADQVPPGCRFDMLLPGRNVIACAADHPLARKPSLRPADMVAFPWIAPPDDSPLHRDLSRVLEQIGNEDVRITFSGGSLAAILNLLAGSQALTVLPHSVVFIQRHLKTLHMLPIRVDHPARTLGLLGRADRPASPPILRLKQHLRREFDGLSRSIREHERNTLRRS